MRDLPKFLKKYFWDVEFSDLDKNKHSQFIIERILEYGDKEAVEWMKKGFEEKEIKKVVCKSRKLSKKSANFWHVIFNIKKSKVLCLKRLLQKKQGLIWKY